MQGEFPKEIAGARLGAVYREKESLEIRYEVQCRERSLLIKAAFYGGSMGYGTYLIVESAAAGGAGELCDLFAGVERIERVSLHKMEQMGYGDYEELEFTCIKRGLPASFLVRAEWDFDDGWLVVEEGRSTLPLVRVLAKTGI